MTTPNCPQYNSSQTYDRTVAHGAGGTQLWCTLCGRFVGWLTPSTTEKGGKKSVE
ncbi:MAG TPA: hypothetical protein V6D10_20665 [Trichocoleus sp.]